MARLTLAIKNDSGRFVTEKVTLKTIHLASKKKKQWNILRKEKRTLIHLDKIRPDGRYSLSVQVDNHFNQYLECEIKKQGTTRVDIILQSHWRIPSITKIKGTRMRLLLRYMKETGIKNWIDLDEEAQTTFLAITNALSKVKTADSMTALDHVQNIDEIVGDPSPKLGNASVFRLYVVFNSKFQQWIQAGAKYRDKGNQPRGTKSAHGHKNYPKSRKSKDGKPNLQWSYSKDYAKGDIDLDGKSGPSHLTRGNSDVREFYCRYSKKYGNPGFGLR